MNAWAGNIFPSGLPLSFTFLLWPLPTHLSHCHNKYHLFVLLFPPSVFLLCCGEVLTSCLALSFLPSLPLGLCLRMKLWGRSALSLQVAYLVALVMLYDDPVSAGNRSHRGPTGTSGIVSSPLPAPGEVNYTVAAKVQHIFPEPSAADWAVLGRRGPSEWHM